MAWVTEQIEFQSSRLETQQGRRVHLGFSMYIHLELFNNQRVLTGTQTRLHVYNGCIKFYAATSSKRQKQSEMPWSIVRLHHHVILVVGERNVGIAAVTNVAFRLPVCHWCGDVANARKMTLAHNLLHVWVRKHYANIITA